MSFIAGLAIGLATGAIIGVVVSALCVASGNDRDEGDAQL